LRPFSSSERHSASASLKWLKQYAPVSANFEIVARVFALGLQENVAIREFAFGPVAAVEVQIVNVDRHP
jgi:hypothetical protein